MTNSFTYDLTFTNDAEAIISLNAMGLRRVDRLGFTGITYADNGARLITIARKSGVASYSITEKAAS
jgi:hypothetical protein